MDPVIANAASLLLTGIFFGAALHKWRDAAEFRRVLSAYEIVPATAVAILARLLPILEVFAALGLAFFTANFVAAALPVTLLLIYTAAIVINLLRGRQLADCGCGGPAQSLSAWLLLRNGVLLLIAFVAGSARIERPLAALDWGITLLAAIAGCLIYYIVNQLLANRDALIAIRGKHA